MLPTAAEGRGQLRATGTQEGLQQGSKGHTGIRCSRMARMELLKHVQDNVGCFCFDYMDDDCRII